jgi:hypothetical protein
VSVQDILLFWYKLKLNSVAWVREWTIPSDRRLSAKLVSTFADSGCRVVSMTDPYDRILGFLDRSRYFFFQVAPQLYSRGWVDPVVLVFTFSWRFSTKWIIRNISLISAEKEAGLARTERIRIRSCPQVLNCIHTLASKRTLWASTVAEFLGANWILRPNLLSKQHNWAVMSEL